jgi:outer membrane protein assembly factor BamB
MKLIPALTALLISSGFAWAGEWSHIMGPRFDRKTTESLPAKWTAADVKRVWEIPAKDGFSSFVTGDGRAYTVVAASDRETAIAVDRKTGKQLWQTPLGKTGYDNGGDRAGGGDGPRATPVFREGRVFVFGGNFDLHALDAATGKTIWSKDLMKEFGGREISWSNAASPLVLADRVIVSGGGRNQSMIAFKPENGEVLWKAGSDRATHSTPILATIHGKEQVLVMVERGLVSRDPANGNELWHYPFPFRTATAASPVVWQDIVNVTAGYGVGGGACKVTRAGEKWTVDELWRSPGNAETAAHWSTAVVHDGYLYGCYGHGSYGNGMFKCIDIRTGKVQWEKSGFGHGAVILAGDKLLATTDAGKLVMMEPDPKAYRELASMPAIKGKVWASLALSDGQVLLRSTTHGVCLQF